MTETLPPEPAETSRPAGMEDDLPSRGLLSFYDRLRERIRSYLERRGGRIGAQVADALLLVPDVFLLLVRLLLDPEVPRETRALIGGAIAYFLLPFDLLPEGLLGPGGFLDDLVLAVLVLGEAMDPRLERVAERHWSGRQRLRTLLADVTRSGRSLVGHDVHRRLERLVSALTPERRPEGPAAG